MSIMHHKHGLVDIITDLSKARLKRVQDINPCFLKIPFLWGTARALAWHEKKVAPAQSATPGTTSPPQCCEAESNHGACHVLLCFLSKLAMTTNRQINSSSMIILKANKCNGSNADFPISWKTVLLQIKEQLFFYCGVFKQKYLLAWEN